MPWLLVLYVLSTGDKYMYQDTFKTAAECKAKQIIVKQQIIKDNPQVQDFDSNFVLVCEPAKFPEKDYK